ncbi:hypothetical protein BDF14DRAFT_1886951 [Spinellus fusiger]|nr:hypothetical protein BDF14DRAFT_1886949 [Spinellus fusiger]KAI7861634.1 hypothetical protein BDF14DRAFT_1886951 [Spinellus fusiger]
MYLKLSTIAIAACIIAVSVQALPLLQSIDRYPDQPLRDMARDLLKVAGSTSGDMGLVSIGRLK